MQTQEMMSDLILSEKKMTMNYSTFASECVNERLRDTFVDLLTKGHKTQTELFKAAQAKGWYQIHAAEKQKVEQAYKKYMNQAPTTTE